MAPAKDSSAWAGQWAQCLQSPTEVACDTYSEVPGDSEAPELTSLSSSQQAEAEDERAGPTAPLPFLGFIPATLALGPFPDRPSLIFSTALSQRFPLPVYQVLTPS